MEYILTTEQLTKIYGTKKAADGVSLHVKAGEVYGLIGRNGAGKTTVLKMICGLSTPTSGSFTFMGKKGREIGANAKKIGSLIETPGIFPKMTAFQNLKLKAIALGKNDDAYIRTLLDRVGLSDVGNKNAGSFSLGMKQRLGIALALVGDPEFIVLDEPINGLDPQGIAEMRAIIRKLSKEQGMTVIVSSHILDELAKVADSFGIIHGGKLIDEFTAEKLIDMCSQYVLLRVNDLEATEKILKKRGISEYKITDEGAIRITSSIEDTSELCAELVTKGIRVYEMAVKQSTLEEYYLTLTGGPADV